MFKIGTRYFKGKVEKQFLKIKLWDQLDVKIKLSQLDFFEIHISYKTLIYLK